MNRNVLQINREFARQPIDLAAMERTQRNNKRTVIDMDRLDTARALELTRMISHDDENLGQIITPIPFSKIEHDTEATLNVVMQALGLYTFPTEELTDWLQGEIDDDPDYEPHTAIEICCGMGWIGPCYDMMVGWLYKGILGNEIIAAKTLLEERVKKASKQELDAYNTFRRFGIFTKMRNDATERIIDRDRKLKD